MKFAVGLLALAAGVGGAGWAGYTWYAAPSTDASAAAAKTIALTVASSNGTHAFQVEVAKSAAEQEKGLMFRTDILDNGGMLFWPYPAGGGAPKEASFWMKNTPSPLDIIFIRANGTIARIAENAIPEDETPIPSGEPVAAVLELKGGRSSALGIAEGDKVTWTGK
ncbi:MAG: DUF192 domain-containing protein [Sphingomonadales bacterium]|nr:DUF192 domain-containing protein [Sphingomonadales bacterium]